MSRIALLCSEPLRARMAGIGIRYLELARRLPRPGIETVLVTAGEVDDVPAVEGEVRRFERGRLAELLSDCDGAVAQGQLANDVLLECPELPVAIDLYDPWLVENLHYAEALGLGPYRNDHATWLLQLSRGDFFLCSSEEQRLFYLGFLTAVGRTNPERVAADPDLAGLIRPVPFGLPDELPAHRPLLAPSKRRRVLFGGLYDWYDPWTLVEALDGLDSIDWSLLLIRNPNPESTPQRLMGEVETWCRDRGWWRDRVEVLDWIPAERRWDLLRDVDVLAAPHRLSLETSLSLRTRFLDALAVGCPILVSAGGTMSRLVETHRAGWVAPAGEPMVLRGMLEEILARGQAAEERVAAGRVLAESMTWNQVLTPLVAFCREPRRDETKSRFAVSLASSPVPAAPSGLRGKIRRCLGRS